jgi:shikimate kinase
MKSKTINIVLIGFMGAGKSRIAAELSRLLQRPAVETDELIVAKEGCSIEELFATRGEDYFRNSEQAVIRQLKSARMQIISCGGGVVLRPENVASLKKNGRIVWLKATPETIFERVKDATHRPLLNRDMSVGHIADLLAARRPVYEQAADIEIVTDQKSAEDVAQEIIRAFELHAVLN